MKVVVLVAIVVAAALGHAGAGQTSSQQSTGVTITFVANEGVLISSGSQKVLIDALFERYKNFPLAPDSVRRAGEGARPPFDSVDLILVTHHHGDHFHPAPVAAHLRANPEAQLVASAQVIDSLRGRLPPSDPVFSRVIPRTTPVGAIRREIINGVPVQMIGFEHHGLEHLGFIVELGGRRILHVGDTQGTVADFESLRLDTARIDVALLPSWMLTDRARREIVEQLVRPKHVVAIHIDEGAGERLARALERVAPGAVVFQGALERREF
jgi:L-ascorbate metabolism protein UlaG (beta-lactamase superfamily)